MNKWMLSITLLLALPSAATPLSPVEFSDDKLKARYYGLIAELRCPQCLNTNLAGSDAMIAQNLRETVRRLLLEGKSDAEVRAFLFERYGDFILYQPRWTARTYLLWTAPGLLVVFGLWILLRKNRLRQRLPAVLNPAEEARLKRLLDKI